MDKKSNVTMHSSNNYPTTKAVVSNKFEIQDWYHLGNFAITSCLPWTVSIL